MFVSYRIDLLYTRGLLVMQRSHGAVVARISIHRFISVRETT